MLPVTPVVNRKISNASCHLWLKVHLSSHFNIVGCRTLACICSHINIVLVVFNNFSARWKDTADILLSLRSALSGYMHFLITVAVPAAGQPCMLVQIPSGFKVFAGSNNLAWFAYYISISLIRLHLVTRACAGKHTDWGGYRLNCYLEQSQTCQVLITWASV